MVANDELIARMRETLRQHADSGVPRSLPPAFYTTERFLACETQQLLRKEWLCLGRVDEVSDPGDYFTVEMLGEPLLVVRGDDARLRVLSNVCRHRSMLVAQGRSRISGAPARSFVCPYHAWTYGRDGSLLGAPLMDTQPGFDKESCALPELRSEIWQGFLYVNLDGNAQALAPRLAGLDDILGNYHTDEMRNVFVAEETWDTNWKCLVENFMEGYHLSRVHPQTLGGRTPTRLCEKFPGADAYTGYRSHYPSSAPDRGKCHPDLSERERRCSTIFSVFPCHVASQASDILAYMCLQPAAVDRVRIRWGVSLYDADLPEAEVRQRIALWQAINAEDRAKLSALQKGLNSRYAASSLLAPPDYEGTVWDFYRFLANRLGIRANRLPEECVV